MPLTAPRGRIRAALSGGDRRSIAQADAVAAELLANPGAFPTVWALLRDADGLVRMRGADALEKSTRANPAPLARGRAALLSHALDDGTPELRWHLVALTSRLALSPAEADAELAYLDELVHTDRSAIVRVMALQAAHDITAGHTVFASMLTYAATHRFAALRARARKLGATQGRRPGSAASAPPSARTGPS